VQLFSPEGDFYGEWRDLYHPMDIYVDGAGTVYVTDQIPRLSMYAPDGRLLARGRPVTIGAHGVWGDSRGNLYLAEVGLNQVTKLARRPASLLDGTARLRRG
jgi:peptidylglycine monooxygenase